MGLNHIVNGSPVEVKHIDYGTSVGYTKVGSPTISNGVASGFSGDNYLSIPRIYFVNNDIEYVIKYSYANNADNFRNILLGQSGSTSLQIHASNDGSYITFYMNNTQHTLRPTNRIDSYSYFRFRKTGTVCTLGVSADKITWEESEFTDYSWANVNLTTQLGRCQSARTSYLSVNLNETYIKINGKLWFFRPTINYLKRDDKLVFADSGLYIEEPGGADYTVVGSPTITDGVVSGFSANDYLTIDQSPTGTITSLEMLWDFTITGPGSSTVMARETTDKYAPMLQKAQSMYLYLYDSNAQSTALLCASITGWYHYIVKLTWDSTSQQAKVYVKENEWDMELRDTQTISSILWNANLLVGVNAGKNAYLDGTLDLNNSYIKINGETWWAGTGGSGGKHYATQDIAPVPAGYPLGNTTTPSIGYVDMRTQTFTAAPAGSVLGKDE